MQNIYLYLRKWWVYYLFITCIPSAFAQNQQLEIAIKAPHYKNGLLTTKKAAVVQGEDFRLQAKHLRIEKTEESPMIYGEKEIFLHYKGSFFRAEKVWLDTNTKQAVLENVTTYNRPFYFHANTVIVEKSGDFTAYDVNGTTEEFSTQGQIHANKLTGSNQGTLLDFEQIHLRFLFVPIYLPFFRWNLQKFSPSILRYNVTWDKGSGPRFSARYRIYSWKNFATFLRGEYRWKKGFGGALETEYIPENRNYFLLTKNYLASDVIPTNLKKERRYRIQGIGQAMPNPQTRLHISWDKYSDPLMPQDFISPDFELNTEKQTFVRLVHKKPFYITNIQFTPKINSFQTVLEKQPEATLYTKSYRLGNWIGNTLCKAGYETVNYANRVNKVLNNFSSGRFTCKQTWLRNFQLGVLSSNLQTALQAICYTNNLENKASLYAQGHYGLCIYLQGRKQLNNWIHTTKPYAHFLGYSPTTTRVDEHHIFSIEDGFTQLHELQTGWKNTFFSPAYNTYIRSNLYTRYFFSPEKDASNPVRIYTDIDIEKEQFLWKTVSCFRWKKKIVEFFNTTLQWTVNKNIACSCAFFYRSAFALRKARKDLYFLENTRDETALLDSPLSDKRSAILAKFFYRFTPFSSIEGSLHKMFLREKQPDTLEYRLEARTLIVANYEAKLTFEHTPTDNRFQFALEML